MLENVIIQKAFLTGVLEKTDDVDDEFCRKHGSAEIGQHQQQVSFPFIKYREDSAHGTPPRAETVFPVV